MQRKVPRDRDLREVPQAKRRPRAKALSEHAREYLQRNDAIVAAYRSGGYTLREIGDYFSLHYSRISKIIHAADLAAGEEKGKTPYACSYACSRVPSSSDRRSADHSSDCPDAQGRHSRRRLGAGIGGGNAARLHPLASALEYLSLHYVLDLWFSRVVRPRCRGEAYYFRFADDFVACFQSRQDAHDFMEALGGRLGKFRLALAEEKTRCIEFGRFARENARRRGEKPGEFTFLGFTHYCGKTKKGHFKLKRRTSRKKLGASLRAFAEWASRARHKLSKAEMIRRAKARVQGHLNYYAITDNAQQCSRFIFYATRILRRWLNRKSQRKAYNWDQMNQALTWFRRPRVRVGVDLSPFRRAEAG
jgi:hypothetical protein